MTTFKVGDLVGSLAKESINRKLATALPRLAPEHGSMRNCGASYTAARYGLDSCRNKHRFEAMVCRLTGPSHSIPTNRPTFPHALQSDAVDHNRREPLEPQWAEGPCARRDRLERAHAPTRRMMKMGEEWFKPGLEVMLPSD